MKGKNDKIGALLEEEYLQNIISRIKTLRENSPDKITQAEIAELLGESRARINRIENNHYPMTVQELAVYAALLDKTPTELLETDKIKLQKRRKSRKRYSESEEK